MDKPRDARWYDDPEVEAILAEPFNYPDPDEMARYEGEETMPIAIDHEALESWYQGQEDIPY